jgi:Tol biopolymer transport system component
MIKRLFTIQFTRFDVTVWSICLGLLGATFLAILAGDRVGITITDSAPSGMTSSTSPIVIRFSQFINRDSFSQHFQIQPPATGSFNWNGSTLTFRPAQPLQPGSQYTVTLRSGMESEGGRQLLNDFSFSFSVRNVQIAYLAPADSSLPANIWIASLNEPSDVRQITFSPTGITGFDVSPTGNQIVFAERNGSTGLSDIKMLDLETDALVQLTNCTDSRCERPIWSPTGNLVAYERVDFNSDLAAAGVNISPSRVWLVDLSANPITTYPLFNDSQILGHSAVWSANGGRIAVYDRREPGVRIYDIAQGTNIVIRSNYGTAGFLSPDGTQLVLPEVEEDTTGMNSHLQLINLITQAIRPISLPTDLVSENVAAWSPNGQLLAISRRSTNPSDPPGEQLYLVDVLSLRLQLLITEANYRNAVFFWDATGTRLLLQRSLQPGGANTAANTSLPEIWIYNMPTSTLTQTVTNAFNPRWLP